MLKHCINMKMKLTAALRVTLICTLHWHLVQSETGGYTPVPSDATYFELCVPWKWCVWTCFYVACGTCKRAFWGHFADLGTNLCTAFYYGWVPYWCGDHTTAAEWPFKLFIYRYHTWKLWRSAERTKLSAEKPALTSVRFVCTLLSNFA